MGTTELMHGFKPKYYNANKCHIIFKVYFSAVKGQELKLPA